MTIAIYSDLQAAVGSWLNRADLSANIPDFITLAEARIAFGSQEAPFQSEPLRIRAMETDATLSITGRTAALPTGFLQAKRFYINTDPIGYLDPVTSDHLWRRYGSASATGQPVQYAMEAGNIVFGPAADQTYSAQLLYYQQFTNFSAPTDTNWLLTNSPGTYLWGALLEAWTFMRNQNDAEMAHKKFVGSIGALMLSNKQDRFSAGPWQAKTDNWTP